MSRGHSQPRAKSGRRSLGVCTERDKIDDVVFIDEDTDNFHNVIVIDVPESSQQRLRSSNISRKDKKFPSSGIISIDDDDSPEKDIESGGDLDNYATSSRASRHASSQSQNSEESDGDECQFIQERKFPLKLSKCKRTYSGKTVSKNCFTSNSVYESSSSESESSDCELMEGPIGKIRDQWEKASRRKKAFKDVRNHQSGLEDQASASGSCTDTQTNVEVDNEAEQHKQTPDGSSSSYVGNKKESLSSSTATGGDSPVADLDPTVERESSSWCKTPSQEVQFSQREDDVQNKAKAFPVDSSFSNEEPVSREPSVWSTREHILRGCFQDREENIAGESCSFKTQSGYNSLLNPGKVWFQDEEASLCDTQRSDQTQFDQGKVISVNENEGTRQEPFSCNTQLPNDFIYERANFEEEKSVSGGPSLCSTQPCSGEQVNNGVAFSKDKFGPSPGYFFCDTQLWNDPEISHGTSICQDKEKPVSEESSSYNAQRDETQVNHGRSCFKAEGEPELISLSNAHLQDEKNSVIHAEKRTGTPDVQNEIISEREKIKETDEYKRAAEQEWASRQRELQIQAEEAQRLKKRKKAETMRLLDMERRQKQRVEEMRETQKKDEETINLKEQLRVQIRKELDRLELMYNDMASLLRGLGIHVGGGIYPMPCEVHAAYKQALLRFHPDRASRTDIRQQVEAEEKFKLISRLKEKFVMTS